MQTGTILDLYPMPPCAAHLGRRMLGHDAPSGSHVRLVPLPQAGAA